MTIHAPDNENDEDESTDRAAQDPLIGTIINDRFRIDERLGSGGMASVYRAHHLMVGRDVAIKFLHRHQHNDTVIRRFQQEARAVSTLSHPNIVTFYDFGTSASGEPYLVMDYLQGENLAQIIKRAPIPLPKTLEIFLQLCDGLQHAHEKGIVHRDLKPSNIIVVDEPNGMRVKIFDFGIAKLLVEDDAVKKLTQTGDVFGSPLYMSPEQCRGLPADARTDVYSLGCVLYEALCGRPPLEGTNAFETMNLHLTQMPMPLAELRPDFPIQLNSILTRALAKTPDSRYTAVADMRFELEMVVHEYSKHGKIGVISANASDVSPIQQRTWRNYLKPGKRMKRAEKIAALIAVAGAFGILFGSILLGQKFLAVGAFLFVLGSFLLLFALAHWLLRVNSVLELAFPDKESVIDRLLPSYLRPANRALAQSLSNTGIATGIHLGCEADSGEEFYFADYMRAHNPHLFLIGKRGSGKSSMLAGMLTRDIAFRVAQSVIVIDRDGDLTNKLNKWTAEDPRSESISDRVTVFDAEKDDDCGFNPLIIDELSPEERAEIVVDAFRVTHSIGSDSQAWTGRSSEILRCAVVLLVVAGRSLNDLIIVLTDDQEREQLYEEAGAKSIQWSMSNFSSTVEAMKQFVRHDQFGKFIDPILFVALAAFSQPMIRNAILAQRNAFSLFDVMKGKKILVVRPPRSSGETSTDLLSSILTASAHRCRELLYRSEETLLPCQLYVEDLRSCVDASLFDLLTRKESRHLKMGLVATLPAIDRLPINFRDLLLSRIALLMAFQVDYPDAAILARSLIPPEAIYSSSQRSMHENVQSIIDHLTRLEPRAYLLWIREASGGIFCMKMP